MAKDSKPKATAKKKGPVVGRLVSKKDHPIGVKINGVEARMSPRAIFENVDQASLDDGVPAGTVFVAYK